MDVGRALSSGGQDNRAHRVGVVKAYVTGASTATVTVDRADLTLPVLEGSYAVGETVLVSRDGSSAGYVVGRIGQPPPPPPPPPPPVPVEPAVQLRAATILPVATGTWRAGWRAGDELYQGDYSGHGLNTGVAHYGDQLVALGAKTAQAHSAVLVYRRARGGVFAAQTPTFWTVTERQRAGAPARAASALGAGVAVDRDARWQLPQAWVTELLTGARGGLAIHVDASSPYIVLNGRSSYGAAMALELSYYA